MRLTTSLFRRPVLSAIPPVTPRPPWMTPADLLDADDADDRLAASEAEGRIARTTERLERLAAELEARHQRYAWTEQLAADLRAIAHDTPPSVGA